MNSKLLFAPFFSWMWLDVLLFSTVQLIICHPPHTSFPNQFLSPIEHLKQPFFPFFDTDIQAQFHIPFTNFKRLVICIHFVLSYDHLIINNA